ncbi:MAG: organic hydroperoxide resistance protein, partial [Candidatus Neomarinimicrobiota bacterium]
MKTLYTTRVTAVGGRNGKVSSQDGILNLQVRAPKEMGGSGGATNPEQLFAAG